MIHIAQAIIVEGKYDKIKLSSILDAVILVTNGFRIFHDAEKMSLIRYYAKTTGVIILTDSDTAIISRVRSTRESCTMCTSPTFTAKNAARISRPQRASWA